MTTEVETERSVMTAPETEADTGVMAEPETGAEVLPKNLE